MYLGFGTDLQTCKCRLYEIMYFHTDALLIIELLYILGVKLMLQIVLDPILSTTLLRNYLGYSVPIK